jgi:hypothetical protein
MNQGMEVVRVKKSELLTTLRKNRTEHREVFEEALEGYRKMAMAALEERIADAKKTKQIDLSFRLVQPVDQTKVYDRIIKMLEMSVDDEIELTQTEFANYVMDDWNWSGQFYASNSTYSPKAAQKIR